MKHVLLGLIFAAACGPFGWLFAHKHHDQDTEVEIVATAVTERIYMITGQGGNIGLAVDDRYTLLIDDQFAPLSAAIQETIAEISDKPMAYLLNTHFHFDHTDGNANFSDKVGVIIAHENVRARLKSGAVIQAFGKTMEPYPADALPTLTYQDGITLYQTGEVVELVHFANAHTDGDTAVIFKDSNVIHTGDLYFSGFYPFIDTSNGGDVHGYLNAMAALIELCDDDTKLIPGHGPLSTKADLIRDRKVLKGMVDAVELIVGDGGGVEELLQSKVIQGYAVTHGGGFLSTETFLTILVEGLKD